jgi:hypothetical protein
MTYAKELAKIQAQMRRDSGVDSLLSPGESPESLAWYDLRRDEFCVGESTKMGSMRNALRQRMIDRFGPIDIY